MDEGASLISGGYVLVEDRKIAYVGESRPECDGAEIISGTRKALLPALINAHTHLPMTAFRGYGEGCDLQTWLNDYIFPAEERWDKKSIEACTNLALCECMASGTASMSDMYMFNSVIAECIIAAGMKGNLNNALVKFGLPEGFDWKTDPQAKKELDLYNSYHGADGGRILVDAGIHAEYTSEPYIWEAVRNFAAERNLAIHLHLSETKTEHEEGKARRGGLTPTQVFEKYGVFSRLVVAAHCVWIEDGDIEIMAKRGATAVHNPISNMKLASGIAPVPKMLAAGVNVALGTDSVSSNNSHDMFEEIKAAAMVSKVATLDPTAVTAMDALKMATLGGAKAQNRVGEMGKIAAGYDADMIMLDLDRPHLYPCHDLISNIVFAARGSDVVMNMVRGKIIYKNGEFLTVDFEKVKYEAESCAKKLIQG